MLGYDDVNKDHSIAMVKVSLKLIEHGYQKDVVALKKSIFIASPFNKIHDKVDNKKYSKYSLFTESEFKAFSNTLQKSLSTIGPSEYLAYGLDHKPLMLGALMVVETYFPQVAPEVRTVIDKLILSLNADDETLDAIVNVHLAPQPDDIKKVALGSFCSCVNFIRMIAVIEQKKGVQGDIQEKTMIQTTREALTKLDLGALKNIETKLITLYSESLNPSPSAKKMEFFDSPTASATDSTEAQPTPDSTTPNAASK